MTALMVPAKPSAKSKSILDGNAGSDYKKSTFTCAICCGSAVRYLKSGEFKRLINKTPSLGNYVVPDSIKIFENLFSVECFLNKNEAQKIFCIVMQNLSYLELTQKLTKSTVHNIKDEMCNFLNHVTQCLFRCTITEPGKVSNIEDIIFNLGKLRHTGCFSNLKNDDLIWNSFDVYMIRGHLTYVYHHFLHLSLDVRWTYLVAAHLHDMANTSNGISQYPIDYDNIPTNSFTQCLRDVVLDLVALSITHFNKIKIHEYFHKSPFPCNCVRELWVMVIRLTDFREEIGLSDSFWVNLRRLVFDLILKEDTLPSSFPNSDLAGTAAITLPSNPTGFCWWLLFHLSKLYHIDIDGNYFEDITTQVRSNYSELCNLLKLSLIQEVGESSLRTYLRCCSIICDSWEPSTDVAYILWDHFFEKLGETFMIPGRIDSVDLKNKCTGDWLDTVVLRTDPNWFFDYSTETSYQIFLGILGPLITACHKFGAEQEWKQLKGRILSKFHPKKMREFSVLALSNAMDLFLTLAYFDNLEEMTQEMLGVIEMLDYDTVNAAHRKVLWTALFVLTTIRVENCLDITLPARKLAAYCEQLINTTPSTALCRSDPDFKSLIGIYVGGTRFVFADSENFALNEHLLLVPELSKLLYDANVNDLTMGMLKRILWKLQTLSEESSIASQKLQFQCVADVLWTTFLPVIKDVSVMASRPSDHYNDLADIASIFVSLVKDLPPTSSSVTKESVASLFNYFSTCNVTCLDFCYQFISKVLSCEDTHTHVANDVPDYQENIIRVWILCAIQMKNDLGRIVLKFPEVLHIFEEAEIGVTIGGSSDTLIIEFFKALGALTAKKSDFRELIAFKKKVNTYVGEMSKIVSNVLENWTYTEEIKAFYNVVGHFVKYCAVCAYTKAKSGCEFSTVITTMILPQVIYGDIEKMSDSVLEAIQDSLHLFVSGLAQLEIRKDPFVARTLRDVFIFYLHPRFSVQQGIYRRPLLIHPLIVCLKDAIEASPEANVKDLLAYSVEVVCSHYLSCRQSKTGSIQRYMMGLTFLRDVIRKCSSVDRANLCVKLLRPLLDIVLEIEPNTAVSSIATGGLSCMLKAANAHCDLDSKMLMKVIVKNFLSHHVVSQSEKAFKTMEAIATAIPYLVADMLSDIAIVVNEAQQAKGSGVDDNLRKSHEHFVRHVERQFTPTGEPKEPSSISG